METETAATASIALQLPSKTSEKTANTKSSQTSRRKFILASIILLLVLVGGICGLLVYLHVIPFGSSSSPSSGEMPAAEYQGDYLWKPSGAEFEIHIDPAQSEKEVDVASSCTCNRVRIRNCRRLMRCEKKWALFISTRDNQLWYSYW